MKQVTKRWASSLAAVTICFAAMAQTSFDKSSAESCYAGYGDNGKVTFIVKGKANFDMPAASNAGLAAFDEALTTLAGVKIVDGKVVFNYLPGDNYKPISAAEFNEILKTEKPSTAYTVDASIKKIADTPKYISMRADSNTKSLASDRYDFSTSECLNYNKETGAIVDYFDVFNASAERKLREMMYPIAAKKYKLTVSHPDEIEIVQNFNITPEGVTFVFPESTIVAGSAGICPQISLTWDQLRRGNTLAEGAEYFYKN